MQAFGPIPCRGTLALSVSLHDLRVCKHLLGQLGIKTVFILFDQLSVLFADFVVSRQRYVLIDQDVLDSLAVGKLDENLTSVIEQEASLVTSSMK